MLYFNFLCAFFGIWKEVSSRDLNTQVKECIADMESAIAAFRTLDSTCRHQIELNKSVASELQQAGVFSSATKKLVL
ncbi:hypothetical protein BDR26DRAFT_853634 [Obelidium mucronatum]|nr:hypothetical protein BDR26DRAFT_853634 [Obelidium mucronatum]